MTSIPNYEPFKSLTENLAANGCLLVTGAEKPNVMTVGWTMQGVIWGRPVMMVPVRLSRYSHDKLEALDEFTINVPYNPKSMADELSVCGSKSGRDLDKIKELGLTLAPSKTISVPGIKECAYFYECKLAYKIDMSKDHLIKEIIGKYYSEGNYHTLYFGEILNVNKN
jgi:flavin reductase (DIM6/NTAB) family NADH-FMN oxidoreductase RutF